MRSTIVKLLRDVVREKRDVLEATKRASVQFGQHDDWPWIGIVLSAATRGGSARWERRVAPRYDSELSWKALQGLSSDDRRQRLLTVGRFKNRAADWLEQAYEQFTREGGPAGVRTKLKRMTAEEVITFWMSFKDVKEKYARNVMMDIYHPDFRQCYFAIDSRILKLLPLLGYAGRRSYGEQEMFLRDLATEVGVESWELDRTLYQAQKQLLEALMI